MTKPTPRKISAITVLAASGAFVTGGIGAVVYIKNKARQEINNRIASAINDFLSQNLTIPPQAIPITISADEMGKILGSPQFASHSLAATPSTLTSPPAQGFNLIINTPQITIPISQIAGQKGSQGLNNTIDEAGSLLSTFLTIDSEDAVLAISLFLAMLAYVLYLHDRLNKVAHSRRSMYSPANPLTIFSSPKSSPTESPNTSPNNSMESLPEAPSKLKHVILINAESEHSSDSAPDDSPQLPRRSSVSAFA